MDTAVLSDLHLGSQSNVLDTPAVRDRLLARVADAEQVLLLGDTLSLRAAPAAEVLAAARPFLNGLGEALGGARVVIVPGNHDHRLAERLLDGDPTAGVSAPLGLERVGPATRELGGALAHELSGCQVEVAYPGLWIRPDVYATHGHYLDCHMTVPRIESLLAAGVQAVSGRLSDGRLSPADYEAVLAPIYAFAYRRAQSSLAGSAPAPVASAVRRASAHGWRSLAAGGALSEAPGRALRAAGALTAVAALNRAGLGPFGADLSLEEIDRAGVRAMAQVVGRLGLDARHVVFGHTHRAGPLAGEGHWTAGATRLLNPGSWVWEPTLIAGHGAVSPYWPGRYVVVPTDGPPELRSALDDVAATEPALG